MWFRHESSTALGFAVGHSHRLNIVVHQRSVHHHYRATRFLLNENVEFLHGNSIGVGSD